MHQAGPTALRVRAPDWNQPGARQQRGAPGSAGIRPVGSHTATAVKGFLPLAVKGFLPLTVARMHLADNGMKKSQEEEGVPCSTIYIKIHKKTTVAGKWLFSGVAVTGRGHPGTFVEGR